jgi:UDP-N-acetylmuramyl pentapeptide phosphotransferase/UDP-N-acetylglucosamine-1-phosphate transferase
MIAAAAVCAALIVLLYPGLERHALVMPNARSSHRTPTPLGGRIAVIAAGVVAVGVAFALRWFDAARDSPLLAIVAAAVLMACIGAIDDFRQLPVGPRLLLQAMLVAGYIYFLPDGLRSFRCCRPGWNERCWCWAACGSSIWSTSWTASTG